MPQRGIEEDLDEDGTCEKCGQQLAWDREYIEWEHTYAAEFDWDDGWDLFEDPDDYDWQLDLDGRTPLGFLRYPPALYDPEGGPVRQPEIEAWHSRVLARARSLANADDPIDFGDEREFNDWAARRREQMSIEGMFRAPIPPQ